MCNVKNKKKRGRVGRGCGGMFSVGMGWIANQEIDTICSGLEITGDRRSILTSGYPIATFENKRLRDVVVWRAVG